MPPRKNMPVVSTCITNTVTWMQPPIEYESTLNTHPALMLNRRGSKASSTISRWCKSHAQIHVTLPKNKYPKPRNLTFKTKYRISDFQTSLFNFNIDPVINTQPSHGGWSNGYQQSELGRKQVLTEISKKQNIKSRSTVESKIQN